MRAPQFKELLADIMQADYFALDTETDDKGLQSGLGSGWFNSNGEVLGISISYYKLQTLNTRAIRQYFPIAHASGNYDRDEVISFLKDLFLGFSGVVVMHNAVYDLGWLRTLGVVPGANMRVEDTGYAAALLDENRLSYSLDDLGHEELGIGKDYSLLDKAMHMLGVRTRKQVMGRLRELPASYVAPYAEQDAEVTLRLWLKFKPMLAAQQLTKLYNMECRLIPMLIAMRLKGVRIDVDRVKYLIEDFKQREAAVQAELDALAGEPFPPTRTAKQIELIAKIVGAENLKVSEKGNYRTGKQYIKHIKHPLFDKITELNHIRKLRKDFLENFLKYEVNGRIHCEFHPLKTNSASDDRVISTKTGRFSAAAPNLTNIPAQGELGHLIRTCFVADDGCQWFCADYAQQEYRWCAHYAIKNKLEGWEAVDRMYKENPDLDFHDMGSMLLYGDTEHDHRRRAKTMGFGIMYGLGLQGLADSLGETVEEAKELMERYREKVPFVVSAMRTAKRTAEAVGYVLTHLGRRRRYDFWEIEDRADTTVVKGQANADAKVWTKGDPWYLKKIVRYKTYSAINSICQGSSADQTKLAALWLFEKKGIVPHVIVHDEFDISVPIGREDIGQTVINTMQNIVKLTIPVKAEGEFGPNWGDAKG